MVALSDASCRFPPRVLLKEQKQVSTRAKLSTIEAKIQSFIPGKLIVVRTPGRSAAAFAGRGKRPRVVGVAQFECWAARGSP